MSDSGLVEIDGWYVFVAPIARENETLVVYDTLWCFKARQAIAGGRTTTPATRTAALTRPTRASDCPIRRRQPNAARPSSAAPGTTAGSAAPATGPFHAGEQFVPEKP